MLNAMFKEIQSRLGEEYGLFHEFSPNAWRDKEILDQYKNIGVLYVNNGNLNKMPDGAMMEISYTLELFVRVEETYNNSTPVVLPLEKFATGTTGFVFDDEGVKTQYILDVGLPASDGVIIQGGDCNFVRYELPITAVFTKGVALSDNNHIVLNIGGVEGALESVLSFVEVPQVQTQTETFVNATVDYPAMQNETMIVGTSWSAQVSKLYRPDRAIDRALRKMLLDNPRQVVTVSYKACDGIIDNKIDGEPIDKVRTRRVIIHDATFSNELGQATYLSFSMSTAMREV